MCQAIGDLLPAAIGVAMSPIPIIAVILMLSTPKAHSNGSAFAVGWVLGLVIVSIIVCGRQRRRRSGFRLVDTEDVITMLLGTALPGPG